MFFTDISSERGELTRAELEADHGPARLAFSQHDVSDCAQWSQVWLRAEAFFGGEVEVYCASKAGVLGLLRSHGARHHRSSGVRMVAICPTLTDTPLIR